MKLAEWTIRVLICAPAILICTVVAAVVTLGLMLLWPSRVRQVFDITHVEELQWAKNVRNRHTDADQQEALPPQVELD